MIYVVPYPVTNVGEKSMLCQKCNKKCGIFRLKHLGFAALGSHNGDYAEDLEVWGCLALFYSLRI